MKARISKIVVGLIILIVIILGVIALRYKSTIDNPLTISNSEVITVNEGDSFYSIINKLSQENKIKNKSMIRIYSKLSGKNIHVLPGKYILMPGMSLKEIVTMLGEEDGNSISVTIPEGYTIDDIANKLEESNICSRDEFINAVKEYPLPSYVKDNPDKRYNLEGFLFPDTYKFEANAEPQYIIETMIKRFEEVWEENTNGLDIAEDDIERVITIASMIEKEARTDEDRSLISSVIYNRLDINMPLQIDATILYAHGYYIESVLNSHLAIDSKYNTYLYYGLPVGPICNPGVKSIEAALNPADTDYLFYLLAGADEHYFTDNYDDFEKKKEELGY